MRKTKISPRLLSLFIPTLVITLSAALAYAFFFSTRSSPLQPIDFSHKTHAQESEIACLYCHIYAKKSSVAGVPSVQKCIGCHEMIALDHPEVQKLLDYWDNRQPIPWKKVYNLPDFVYFSHRMHLNADLACEQCHGDVSEMEQVKQVSSLEMGWCLKCHRKMDASIDCWVCHK
ncbi:MAG: cytochrome c3 family protein [Nitrospiria bacterium]